MRVLGVHVHKAFVRHAVIEGTVQAPVYVCGARTPTSDPTAVPALMDWFETRWQQMILDYAPERIAYRLTLEPNKEQIIYAEFPLGVLNLVAYRHNIPITAYTARSFTPTRLGHKKGTDLNQLLDQVVGTHPPYWDQNQRYAALVAWFALGAE